MVIQHNLQSMNINRQFKINTGIKTKSTEKLSSGYKINRAADDAAGLSISEKMRWQFRGLDQASENAAAGISLIQTAEGALGEVHSMLQRMKELSTQAANDTNTPEDRAQIQLELDQLTSEVNRIASTTQFNTMNLLDGSLSEKDDFSTPYKFGNIEVTFELIGTDGKIGSTSGTSGISQNHFSAEEQALADFVREKASSVIAELYSAYPKLFDNAGSSNIKIGLSLNDTDGTGGTLAYAAASLTSSSVGSSMQYRINVDPADYPPGEFSSMTDSKKAELAATIAHEMTHMVMYDTLTNGMMGSNQYPSWFQEGTAQTSSGDGGWLTNYLSTASSDSSIQSYMKNGSFREYGAGYVASAYLGYLASGTNNINNIQSGLGKVFNDLSSGKTLNEVIKKYTPYQGIADFENHVFHDADAGTIDFTRKLLTAIGTNGSGSVLGDGLSSTVEDNFITTISGTGTNYIINTSYESVWNSFGNPIDLSFGGSGVDTSGTVPGNGGLNLQVGALSGQKITVVIDAMNASALGISGMTVDSFENAGYTMEKVDKAIDKVSRQRAKLGAYQNRLEHTIANLDTTSENTKASESRIRDTDMAKEMVQFSISNILEQAGQSMLAQANQSPQRVLSLLQ